MTKEEIGQFYDNNFQLYTDFKNKLVNDLRNLTNNINLSTADVTGRVKGRLGYIQKAIKNDYIDLKNELTDFAGVRIITHNTEQVDIVANCIEKEYRIDWKNSSDKKKELNIDQVGYISNHYIISLDSDQLSHNNNERFKGLKAELQIRTWLQHAWAELSHDKVYKNKGNLTPDILRRVNVFAGFLEVADEQIMLLNKNIDSIISSTTPDSVSELNEFSLMSFMNKKFDFIQSMDFINVTTVLRELKTLNINRVSDLNQLISPEFINYVKLNNKNRTFDGIVRNILAINFKEKYFTDCKIESISQYTRDLLNYFKEKIDFDIDFYCKESKIVII